MQFNDGIQANIATEEDKKKAHLEETSQNIPESITALKEGARVIGNDGQLIGSIERVITNEPEEKITHLLVSQGLIWIEKKLLPVNCISNVAEEAVTLSVSSKFVENLPEHHSKT